MEKILKNYEDKIYQNHESGQQLFQLDLEELVYDLAEEKEELEEIICNMYSDEDIKTYKEDIIILRLENRRLKTEVENLNGDKEFLEEELEKYKRN